MWFGKMAEIYPIVTRVDFVAVTRILIFHRSLKAEGHLFFETGNAKASEVNQKRADELVDNSQ